jgi:hypothetical protein
MLSRFFAQSRRKCVRSAVTKRWLTIDVNSQAELLQFNKAAQICIFREVMAERSFLEHNFSADERHLNRVVIVK